MSTVAGSMLAGGQILVPLALAAPVGGRYVLYDHRRGRSWQAEVLALLAVGSVAPMEAPAGGRFPATGPVRWS